MDQAVQDDVDAIDPRTRPLFDRLHRLVLEVGPDADVVLSCRMPTYVVGERRLHSGKGTLRLTHRAAATIDDDELRGLLQATLAP